jgi:ribosomal protein S18 acetylase RimI-like enzyme
MLKANYTDKELTLDILCKSFDTNKSVNYVVKQHHKREKRIRILMDYSFEICYRFGEVYLSENKDACALILFPDKKKSNLKTVLLDAKLAISCVGITRIGKILERDSKIKSAYPDNKIVYLWFIGVLPEVKQQGIGSALLKGIIEKSNALKRPIYLETSMIENLKFYDKFGFHVYKELDFGYTLYLIRRELN